ncbi:hypothetical protein E3H11_10555 [Bradyrhizobium brasilense]|uniref:plasmid replication protein, CyRepA1 family n=1 Tax=Bradyrhizobium brasilense TaxID=1419277 RepID=UPI0014576396|nr:plasmid replication protein, CyRepA1 family [Bradyrhizobium brasilense]NLS69352.1 hypothetical protein [Bradyrhizobium brasilense]
MQSLKPTYSISVNTQIADKPDPSERGNLGKNWQPVEATLDDLADHISRGHAIAPQFKGSQRKTIYFSRAGFLAADVDEGMTLDEAKAHAMVRHHAGLIHTTVSHTSEKHRFRIIFVLDEAILSPQDWADAQLGLAAALGSDRSVSDGARMFFGNSRAVFFRISMSMPPELVADLIARGRDTRAQKGSPADNRWSIDSSRKMGPGELVKLATGGFCRMDELKIKAAVCCPYHADTNPSAFVLKSRRGNLGIFCSACKVTFWPDDQRDTYDFDAFDKLFEAKRQGDPPSEDEAIGFERFFPPEPKFVRYQQAFLPTVRYFPGITLVKSRKGSGKTEALVSMIQLIRAGQLSGGIKKGWPKSILLVGHRRTLIREAAAKLGLRCYIEPEDEGRGGMTTLAVCLDSLPKYSESFDARNGQPAWRRKGPFDLVILDEVEQLLKHLLSETIKRRAGLEQCFDALEYEVTHAKAVIALDADLGLLTAQAMKMMRPRDWESNCRIIYNAPIVSDEKRAMRLYRDRKLLEMEFITAVRRGERCFVASNSKEFILNAERMIRNECGDKIVMRVVTGENSQDEAVVNFVKNIRTEFLKVQVVLASPSLGTGIDISFPDGGCKVDRVFGFFYSMVNAHTDIDQQLCRVRNPGAVDVWISPTTFDFTCNVEVVKDDLARAYTVSRAVKGRRPDGMVHYDPNDPLLTICAHVTALERASKNRLVELFCKLREQDGWVIHRVEAKVQESPYEDARGQRRAERAAMLLNAPALTDPDYIDLDVRASGGAALLPEERAAYDKYVFESTVGVSLDAQLVDMNLDGRLIERVQTLAELTALWMTDDLLDLLGTLAEPSQLPKGRLQMTSPARMIGVLMRVSGLTTAAGLKAGHLVTVAGLAEFVRVCRENRTVIEEIFAEAMRQDLERNPVRQLNRFLGRIGLRLNVMRTEKTPSDGKIRYYALDPDVVERMTSLAAAYSDVQRSKEAHDHENGMSSSRRPSRDQTPQQGTAEEPAYMNTNTNLLSLSGQDQPG